MNAERKSTRFSWNKTSASPRSTAIPPAYGEHQILFYLFLPALFLVLAPSAAAQSVGLTWSASASIVIGYNIYRGNQPGGPYNLLNSSLDRGHDVHGRNCSSGQVVLLCRYRGQLERRRERLLE